MIMPADKQRSEQNVARVRPDGATRVDRASARTRARVLILALGAVIVFAVAPFLAGLLGAVVLDVVSAPVYRRVAPRVGRRWGALLVTVGVAIVLVVPVALLTFSALSEAPGAFQRAVQSDAFARLATLRIGPIDVGDQLRSAGQLIAGWVSRQALAVVGSVTRGLLNFFIASVGLYYLLRSGDGVWAHVRPFIPFSAHGAEVLRERFTRVTEATILGILATGLAQGSIVGLGFWGVGLSNPIVWGGVTAVVSMLPILGSSLVWAPGVIVLVAEQRYVAALVLGIIGFVFASNVDNAIRPLVYRRVSGIHPMTTLIGAFAGVELMGLIGLLLGPLAIAYFFELVEMYEAEYGTPRTPSAG